MKRIHAYFESMCEARNAAAALSGAGLGKAHLDLAGALDYDYSQEISAIGTNSPSEEGSDHLSSLMMGLWARGLNDGRSVSNAPGIINPNRTECEEGELKISTRLILKVPEESAEKAFGIIGENGGRIFPEAVL